MLLIETKKLKQALIIFVRKPEKGKVKTRLASGIGDIAALFVYEKLLEHTRNVCHDTSADKFVFYNESVPTADAWSETEFRKQVQASGDLGEKMKDAFARVFSLGYDSAMIIGSDCPGISAELIEQAFGELKRYDCVIGPATDGGYYLLGMRTMHPEFFHNKSWSTSQVLQETLNDIAVKKLTVAWLKELNDVDTIEDLPSEYRNMIDRL